jgi:hypothetical protein
MYPFTTPSRGHRKSFALLHVPIVWFTILLPSTMAAMPYNPTRILQNGSNLYIFQPSSSSSSQFELGSIDISSKIDASDLPYTTLYPALPFLDSNTQRPFTPILDNGGNITVYTGDCAMGASGAEIWAFTPETSDKSGNGSWNQEDLSFDKSGKRNSAMGSSYLNGGMAFSALVNGDAMDVGAYFFGGMCPFQTSNDSDWQSSANYSNLMVTLEPSQDGTKSLNYQLDISTSRGPPIAEAGFTLTGLQPSFSNRSDGTQTQQQDFVLVGGHTSAAFINMSQVALFSLPQQGWSFIPVQQPNTQQTDLAVRTNVQEVEPRSGHSAVLTPDGQRIIVYGGWIGDIDTPADPQFAILNVGDGYGGQGDWEWTVPTTSGSGIPTGSGLYGHGAAMLPGGVMMIMGGYSIPAPSSRRRRADSSVNTNALFFNVTSNNWISGYTPPADIASSQPARNGLLSTASQKAGLGVGLGIGMATVLSLLIFYFWYIKRTRNQREVREKQLRDLAIGAHRYNLECLSPGVDGRGGNIDAMDYLDENDAYFYPAAGNDQNRGWRQSNGGEAERTGLLVEIPSPTRGLRRSLSGRNQAMSRYDERRVRGSGHIHPIDELEEEPEISSANENIAATDKTPLTDLPEMSERAGKKGKSVLDNAPTLDPFTDRHRANTVGSDQINIIHSAPASPVRERGEEPPNDWQLAIDALLPPRCSTTNSAGRVSPTKSERTRSDLSERSTWSNVSSNSTSLGRNTSMRSAALLNSTQANPFRSPDHSPTTDQSPIDPRTRSFTSTRSYGRPNTANADADSFTTARTSFLQLQAEGEVLLGGNPDRERERARPGTSSTSNGSSSNAYQTTEPSMSRAGTVTAATSLADGHAPFRRPNERRMSWLGSVRRVLSRSITVEARTRSLTTSTPMLESYTDDPIFPAGSSSKDNRRSLPASSPPRRAASDASFWRSKRGKQDWLDEELDPNDPSARWRRNSGDDWGAPEDVALAEQERRKREWRERSVLINLNDDLPTPLTPIKAGDLGVPDAGGREKGRPRTPMDEEDWDVEAAVERRVVQVMFTVPKSKLRVVNADVDHSSLLSLTRETSDDNVKDGSPGPGGNSNSPGRVRDLAGRFEQLRSSPRTSPRPSPSPSIKSLKIRNKASAMSLAAHARADGSS